MPERVAARGAAELRRARAHAAEASTATRCPVAGVAGDQQAALFGQALPRARARQEHVRHRLVRAAQHRATSAPPRRRRAARRRSPGRSGAQTTYALEAAIFVTGAAVQWLRDGLGIIEAAAETEALAALARRPTTASTSCPALTGLGSPHWDPYARGTIVGLTRGSERAHLARATLEAMAYQTVDAVRAMEAGGGEPLAELRADGGATANGWLMQFQADVLGVPVVVPEVAETTALGAALLAGVGAGLLTLDQVGRIGAERARYEPRMGDDERDVAARRLAPRAGARARAGRRE